MKKRRFTWRSCLSAIASIIFVLFLAGCGDKSEAPTGEQPEPPQKEGTKTEHPEHPEAGETHSEHPEHPE